jgi:hypothetical protein
MQTDWKELMIVFILCLNGCIRKELKDDEALEAMPRRILSTNIVASTVKEDVANLRDPFHARIRGLSPNASIGAV